ncbi:MAG TPA: rRNA methyltransferase [Gammaproteobacteria bacterium]|nr:rRNA methyltransferase [Gammaproteobacteria bacterium]
MVVAQTPALVPRAQALARELGLAADVESLAPSTAPGLMLYIKAAGSGYCLELRDTRPGAPRPLSVDFSAGAFRHRRRQGLGRREPLARAVGLKPGHPAPEVVDATAGLGRDAFVLASLGCQVTLLERAPVVAALLADGLRRAAGETGTAPVVTRMRLLTADAADYFSQPDMHPSVVYLDPMFPDRGKSALVKKEMRMIRALSGDDPDADRLLNIARARARRRVVVKRHRLAPALGSISPDFSITGKTTRFDVYLAARAP